MRNCPALKGEIETNKKFDIIEWSHAMLGARAPLFKFHACQCQTDAAGMTLCGAETMGWNFVTNES